MYIKTLRKVAEYFDHDSWCWASLYSEASGKVEVSVYYKYNFVTSHFLTTIAIYFLHLRVDSIEALYVMKYVWKTMQCIDLYEVPRLALLPYPRLQSVNAGAPHYFLPYYFSVFITCLYVQVSFLMKLRVCIVVSNEYTFLQNILVDLRFVNYITCFSC